MRKVFEKAPLAAFRRDANLQDILIHSKHRKSFAKGKDGTQKCGRNCVMCKHMAEDITHRSLDGKEYTFKDKVNCKTSNIIYGIKCDHCGKIVYVGETGTSIYERFQNHLSSIRRMKDDPVANHFQEGEHMLRDVKIIGIEKMKTRDIHFRKVRESFWIQKLKTLTPQGLNQNLGIGDGTRGITHNV